MKLDQMLPPATAKEGWFELYEGDRGKHEHVEHSLYVYSILHYLLPTVSRHKYFRPLALPPALLPPS